MEGGLYVPRLNFELACVAISEVLCVAVRIPLNTLSELFPNRASVVYYEGATVLALQNVYFFVIQLSYRLFRFSNKYFHCFCDRRVESIELNNLLA